MRSAHGITWQWEYNLFDKYYKSDRICDIRKLCTNAELMGIISKYEELLQNYWLGQKRNDLEYVYSIYSCWSSVHLPYRLSSFCNPSNKKCYLVTEIQLCCYYHTLIIWRFPPFSSWEMGNSQMKWEMGNSQMKQDLGSMVDGWSMHSSPKFFKMSVL